MDLIGKGLPRYLRDVREGKVSAKSSPAAMEMKSVLDSVGRRGDKIRTTKQKDMVRFASVDPRTRYVIGRIASNEAGRVHARLSAVSPQLRDVKEKKALRVSGMRNKAYAFGERLEPDLVRLNRASGKAYKARDRAMAEREAYLKLYPNASVAKAEYAPGRFKPLSDMSPDELSRYKGGFTRSLRTGETLREQERLKSQLRSRKESRRAHKYVKVTNKQASRATGTDVSMSRPKSYYESHPGLKSEKGFYWGAGDKSAGKRVNELVAEGHRAKRPTLVANPLSSPSGAIASVTGVRPRGAKLLRFYEDEYGRKSGEGRRAVMAHEMAHANKKASVLSTVINRKRRGGMAEEGRADAVAQRRTGLKVDSGYERRYGPDAPKPWEEKSAWRSNRRSYLRGRNLAQVGMGGKPYHPKHSYVRGLLAGLRSR